MSGLIQLDHTALLVKAVELQEACEIYESLVMVSEHDWDGKCEVLVTKARLLVKNEHTIKSI